MKHQTNPFVLSKRHYALILNQATKNLPQESGGFLGGTDRIVKAVLPAFNQHIGNRTDTFGLTSEDIQRAHAFFAHHGLTYFGVYHSHPNGDPYPSNPDIQTGQRYHFIIGCRNPEKPILAAYEIINNIPEYIPIKLLSDTKISVKDIHTPPPITPKKQIPAQLNELSHLIDRIDNVRQEKPNIYPKLPSSHDSGDFSTLA